MRLAFSLTLLALVWPLAPAFADDRLALPLDWSVGRDPAKLAKGPPRLPFAANQEDVFARGSFEVTASVASRALVLELSRVRWDATVSLDGRVLREHVEGDARLDLGALAAGKHDVLVRARDVRAAAVAGRKATDDDSVEAGWREPVGEAPRLAGVLGPARVSERLPVEVLSVEVACSPGREPELVLEVEGARAVEGARSEPGPVDLGFVSSGVSPLRVASVSLAPGERGRVALPWPEAPRFLPHALPGGEARRALVDVLVGPTVVRRERLAARTLEVANGRLCLDGAPVPFFVLDAPRGEGEAAARDAIALARATGATVLATRGERDDAWLEAVESAGLLVLWESELAAPTTSYALDDERFWRALRRQVLATAARHRGRPSIVAWGLARSVLAEGAGGLELARARLASLAAEVRAADPTRLALLPGDDGRALGASVGWLPAASAEPGTIALLPPASPPRELARRVALAGREGFLDDARVEPPHARDRARLALEARARGVLGIDLGAAPESEASRAELARALAPFVLVAEPGRAQELFAGARAALGYRLVSDAPSKRLSSSWSLAAPGAAALEGAGGEAVSSAPARGRPWAFDVAPPIPDATARRELVLRVEARADGAPVASASQTLVVWPARPAPLRLARRVLLADVPGGRTGEALLEAGVPWREAAVSPTELDAHALLVVGEGALDEKATREPTAALVERAKRVGAGVLVLRQTTPLPPGVAPPLDGPEPRGARAVGLAPGAAGLLDGGDPGLVESDLARAGLELPPPGLARPQRADARVLLESAPGGVEGACAAIACEDGAAEEIVCQLPLASLARTSPVARATLAALVRAAGEPVLATARPLFTRAEPDVDLGLEALALAPSPLDAAALDLAREPVVFLAAATHGGQDPKAPALPLTPPELAAIERAVLRGGSLVVEVGSDAALARLGSLVEPGLKVEKTAALPSVPAWGPRELSALDLLWPPGPGGVRELGSRFDAAPRLGRLDGATALVAPGALLERPLGSGRVILDLVRWRDAANQPAARRYVARVLRHAGAETKEPPVRLPAAAWNGVGKKDGVVQFFSNATATARFQARRAGRYRVTLLLGGTPASGGWPLARVHCDAQNLGEVAVEGPGPARYEREVVLAAGSHQLSVAFGNDAAEAPEDRNLWFEGAVLEPIAPRIY